MSGGIFDYGYSNFSGDTYEFWEGIACSANETSHFHVNGNETDVAEGHWARVEITAGLFWFGVTSNVNSSSNEHLHSYCGYWVDWF
jgi:hypothetical protein